MYPRQARRREGLGLLLLVGQLMRVGFDRIPPTTLGTIALNVAIFLKVLNPHIRKFFRDPSIGNVCVSTYKVWYQGDWSRLASAAWFHLDDWHLYFNMVSFLWKGMSLERRFGSAYFAYLILAFSLLTSAVMVGLNVILAEITDDGSHVVSCAAGFSGVLFALKVLTTHYTPAGTQYVMGFPVPSRYACWAELVLIQVLVPRASFTGHLAGILVGLAYVGGPLKSLLDVVPALLTPAQGAARMGGRSFTYTAGRTSQGRGTTSGRAGYGNYTAGMNEEEQMQEAIRASLRAGGRGTSNAYRHSAPSAQPSATPGATPSATPSAPPSAPPLHEEQHRAGARLYPDLSGEAQATPSFPENEELRRRRLARFARE